MRENKSPLRFDQNYILRDTSTKVYDSIAEFAAFYQPTLLLVDDIDGSVLPAVGNYLDNVHSKVIEFSPNNMDYADAYNPLRGIVSEEEVFTLTNDLLGMHGRLEDEKSIAASALLRALMFYHLYCLTDDMCTIDHICSVALSQNLDNIFEEVRVKAIKAHANDETCDCERTCLRQYDIFARQSEDVKNAAITIVLERLGELNIGDLSKCLNSTSGYTQRDFLMVEDEDLASKPAIFISYKNRFGKAPVRKIILGQLIRALASPDMEDVLYRPNDNGGVIILSRQSASLITRENLSDLNRRGIYVIIEESPFINVDSSMFKVLTCDVAVNKHIHLYQEDDDNLDIDITNVMCEHIKGGHIKHPLDVKKYRKDYENRMVNWSLGYFSDHEHANS